MLDATIEAFFAERKEAWLKKNLKASMEEHEVRELELECEEIFALKNWLPNAAKRAGQISLASHPCTFSHPSARKNKNGYVSSIIAKADRAVDGFLRSGNLQTEPDALGNAAALDVYKFLTLVMADGDTLLDHLQRDSELAKNLLASAGGDAAELKSGFLAMVATKDEAVTSSKIKQVYFPVAEEAADYHLLSILSNSGHMFEMRKRLDRLRFSEETKAARELRKSNHFSETGYQEIYNLTTIGYGGTKPQNISVLNNQNAGKAHLLLSMPPELSPRSVRLPTRNFFGDVLYSKQLQQTFQAFHRLLSADYNNLHIRNARDYRIQEYLDQLILNMWQVRNSFGEQPHARPEHLVGYQKQWLFPEHEAERTIEAPWLTTLIEDATRHFIHSYQKVAAKSAIQLGDTELQAFSRIIEQNKEALL
ncbi:type I-F CRISPR-associated protein Csy1 [Oceanisphaera arctica]|uniref:Type I-F CRISPR-associated protein Csy1 n=1 Tax=Oceanisphaera arctica TaxID=641510 RepID=A0A2P5TII7_9GAMM|nr:type I-F CRISPR-associated protein Csy1 [Oceanisphaera arctica]PPL14585.1 type I-F CRISPR-associated protein Csy1 [Oceanisphaera arctica]GHA17796.1 type I-F CRISPR-associated protein Csy1 [Oceanisphaera arctica]